MKKILLSALSILTLHAQESLQNMQLPSPWEESIASVLINVGAIYGEAERDNLRSMIQKGEFETLRQTYFPGLNAELSITEDHHIVFNIKDADINDIISYWNFCNIYADLFTYPDVFQTISNLSGAPKHAYLEILRDALLHMYRGTLAETSADEFESSLALQKEPPRVIAICDTDGQHLYLYALSSVSTHADIDPEYNLYSTKLLTKSEEEDLLKMAQSLNGEITSSQLLLYAGALEKEWNTIHLLTSEGCFNTRPRYTLSKIQAMIKKFAPDQFRLWAK